MDEFPQPPSAKSQVAANEDAIKAERRKQKKQAKLTKPPKPERYRHTPTFAAQSFTMTATPDIFLRNQTHKHSHPMLDLTKSRRAPSPNVVQPFDDRSSGEYDRSALKTPTRDPRKSPGFAPNRFLPPSPHYELFSSTILNQQAPGTTGRRTPVAGDSYTRGRPDWSEMDERASQKPLKRTNSAVSAKSSKSHRRPRSQSTDLATVLKGNTVLRIPRDDESIYQGRGCVPWRIRV